jgi:TPR repeat protein
MIKLIWISIFLLFFAMPIQASHDEALKAYKKGDYSTAFKLLKASAHKGNIESQVGLGTLYRTGKGTQQNYSKAFEWYSKAAAQGHAGAQSNVANMYKNGQGVTKNMHSAFDWFYKAAVQGNTNAQFNMGNMYLDGRVKGKDLNKALFWYLLAADNGEPRAQVLAGIFLIESDRQKALKMFRTACDIGFEPGCVELKKH